MTVNIVAILSPGDTGHVVGRALGKRGLDVITCLEGRSERTSIMSSECARLQSTMDAQSLWARFS